jgi:hypothetical protein
MAPREGRKRSSRSHVFFPRAGPTYGAPLDRSRQVLSSGVTTGSLPPTARAWESVEIRRRKKVHCENGSPGRTGHWTRANGAPMDSTFRDLSSGAPYARIQRPGARQTAGKCFLVVVGTRVTLGVEIYDFLYNGLTPVHWIFYIKAFLHRIWPFQRSRPKSASTVPFASESASKCLSKK